MSSVLPSTPLLLSRHIHTAGTFASPSGVVHILVSGDLSVPVINVHIDDVSDKVEVTLLDDIVDFTRNFWGVGADNAGANKYDGVFGPLYFAPGQYLDTSQVANRRKFYAADLTQAYLGEGGSIPTGVAPLIFMTGGAGVFGVNRGMGGAFTEQGSPATVNDFISGPEHLALQANLGFAGTVPSAGVLGRSLSIFKTGTIPNAGAVVMKQFISLAGIIASAGIHSYQVFTNIPEYIEIISKRLRTAKRGGDSIDTASSASKSIKTATTKNKTMEPD